MGESTVHKDVCFPTFLRCKDDTQVMKFDSLAELHRYVEAIDVENAEYEGWDNRGFRLRLRLLDHRRIEVETTGDLAATDEGLRALAEFAAAEGASLRLPSPGETLLSAYEIVSEQIQSARSRKPWLRRHLGRKFGIAALCVVLIALIVFYLERLRTPIDAGYDFHLGRTRTIVGAVGDALQQFHSEVGRYPTLEEGLEALGQEIEGKGPFLRQMKSIPDGWRHPLIYRPGNDGSGTRLALYSVGPNGKDEGGAGDDISFWSEAVQKEVQGP